MNSTTMQLTHWLSPAFPTGAFAYSHGLEQVIALGALSDAASLENWLRDVLHHGAGWQDAVLLALALARDADLDALNTLAQALQPCAERWQESSEQGAAFARTVAQISNSPLPKRALPIAVAQAARALKPDPATVIALYLQGFATNLVTIAIRHVPIGQCDGHAVLARLLPSIAALAERAARAGMEDLGTACLGADMAAMEHETKEVRLFRT